jgi:hypothetical protein
MPGSRPSLRQHEVELGLLRRVQVGRPAPVAAAVDHALAEHRLVQVVAQVVVALADLEAPAPRLQVEQPRAQGIDRGADAAHALVEADLQQAAEQAVQRARVPPAVHTTRPGRARQHPGMEPRVVDLHVPGAVAVDLDVGARQQGGHAPLQGSCKAVSALSRHLIARGIAHGVHPRPSEPARSIDRGVSWRPVRGPCTILEEPTPPVIPNAPGNPLCNQFLRPARDDVFPCWSLPPGQRTSRRRTTPGTRRRHAAPAPARARPPTASPPRRDRPVPGETRSARPRSDRTRPGPARNG